MAHADLPLLVTLGALLGLAALTAGLVGAIWHGRSLPFAPIAAAVLLMLVGARAFSQSEARPREVLVAAATHREPGCRAADPTHVTVSGQRVRVGGLSAVDPGCGLWAVIADPRTGLLWVQGPAVGADSGWTLDLVLGAESPNANPLPYHISMVAIPPDAHETWLSVALQGAPIALNGQFPPSWVTRGVDVVVE